MDNESSNTPEIKPKRKPGRPPGALQDVQSKQRVEALKATGKLLPTVPTTAEELAHAWSVPESEAYGVSVKVLRQRPGTNDMELLASVPLMDYQLETLSGRYGPGVYYIKCSAGPFGQNATKVMISQEMAHMNGYGALPRTASDVQAERVIRNAAEVTGDSVGLLAAMERMIERKFAERSNPMVTPGSADPMKSMENMLGMFQMMGRIQEEAMKSVKLQMGVKEEVTEPKSTMELLLTHLAPVAMQVVEKITAPRAVPLMTHVLPTTPIPVVGGSVGEEEQVKRMEPNVGNLSSEEQEAIAPALAMLNPFRGMLLKMEASGKSHVRLGEDLAGFIPPACYDALDALTNIAKTRGHGALSVIGPEFATDRWLQILAATDAALKSVGEQ